MRSRWAPVVAYAAVSASNQMLWLTFTPITTASAHHYGVSSGAIGWLAELFPLLYVLLALPAGRLVDRNLALWLGAGAMLTAAGGLVRLTSDTYGAVLAGQALVAIAQPLILNAVTSVSAATLRERDRPTGIAVSSAGVFAGMVLALLLGAAIGTGHLGTLLGVQAALSVLAAVALCGFLRGVRTGEPTAASGLRAVWADRDLRVLVGLACFGFGVFVALTTWLQTLLHPAGVSDSAAGYLLLAMVIAGVAGSAVLPPAIARAGRQRAFIAISVVVAAVAMALLAARPGVGTGLTALVPAGLLLLADLPVLLELAERRAGPAGGTASALVWLAGNAAGLVVALVVQAVVHHPAVAFTLLAVLLVAALPLVRQLRPEPAATFAGEPRV